MKTFLAVLAGAAAFAATGGQAQAAQSPEQRIVALERQVAILAARPQAPAQAPVARQIATLQRRATALERRVRTLEASLRTTRTQLTQTASIAALGVVYGVCLTAVTADTFSGTWNVIDQIATTAQARTYFGPQPVVSDVETCQALELTRAPTVPPTLGPFSALTALLADRVPR